MFHSLRPILSEVISREIYPFIFWEGVPAKLKSARPNVLPVSADSSRFRIFLSPHAAAVSLANVVVLVDAIARTPGGGRKPHRDGSARSIAELA